MATKSKSTPVSTKIKIAKRKRPNIHSKKKHSSMKSSKNYKKSYKSQGR